MRGRKGGRSEGSEGGREVEESLLDWLLGKPGRFLMTREKSLRKHIDHYSVCESATREPTEPVICLSVTK